MCKLLKLKDLRTNLILVFFSIFISLLFGASSARGAELYFGSQSQEQGLNNQFAVGLFINTQDQRINAIEGKVVFPSDSLELVGVRDGDSVVNFWVESPEVSCKDECAISFGGITPGGYVGNKGHVFLMIFKPKELGNISIKTIDDKVLLHDGSGTEAELTRLPITLKILEEVSTPEYEPPFDIDPPESFVPFIDKDPEMFNNKLFLVFATQDKLSGIDYYEIAENKKEVKSYDKLDWQVAKSPFLLKDQELFSFVYIKAVDKSGNKRIQIIPPQNTMSLFRKYGIYAILFVVIIPYLFWRILWRKKD